MQLTCFSCIWLFATLWTIAHLTPLCMVFSSQEYWSGLSCPLQGDLCNPGIKPTSLMFPALAGRFFTTNATQEPPQWIVQVPKDVLWNLRVTVYWISTAFVYQVHHHFRVCPCSKEMQKNKGVEWLIPAHSCVSSLFQNWYCSYFWANIYCFLLEIICFSKKEH